MLDIGIIAEIIGWIAFAFSMTSCLSKNGRTIILFQVPSNILWTMHLGIIGAIGGALMCGIAATRNFLGLHFTEKQNRYVFLAIIPIVILLTIFFGEGPVAYLVAGANIIMGGQILFKDNARMVRACNVLARSVWFFYGLVAGSVPTMALELSCIVSVLIATYRYDPFFVALRAEKAVKLQSVAAE